MDRRGGWKDTDMSEFHQIDADRLTPLDDILVQLEQLLPAILDVALLGDGADM